MKYILTLGYKQFLVPDEQQLAQIIPILQDLEEVDSKYIPNTNYKTVYVYQDDESAVSVRSVEPSTEFLTKAEFDARVEAAEDKAEKDALEEAPLGD